MQNVNVNESCSDCSDFSVMSSSCYQVHYMLHAELDLEDGQKKIFTSRHLLVNRLHHYLFPGPFKLVKI